MRGQDEQFVSLKLISSALLRVEILIRLIVDG